jgi:hypothetical protein
MYISFALFADAANLSQEGKLNILGVYDAVQVQQLPTVHPRTTMVMRLKAEPDDLGAHRLKLRWVSPEGDELWSSDGELNVGAPPDASGEVDFPLIAALDLPLDEAGEYSMEIELDGEAAAEIALHVREATPSFEFSTSGALPS